MSSEGKVPEGRVTSDQYRDHAFVAHWRECLLAAKDEFGGIAWSINRLYRISAAYEAHLDQNVGIATPSVFKRCAAMAFAFLDESVYPIYGEFERHPLLKNMPGTVVRPSGVILVYEYIRFCLHEATIHREDGSIIVLSEPIEVSQHTFYDLAHALSLLDKGGPAAFHLLALLLEHLAYYKNPGASYDRVV